MKIMDTKNLATPASKENIVPSEEIASEPVSTCCFPGNDASLCCSPNSSVQHNKDYYFKKSDPILSKLLIL